MMSLNVNGFSESEGIIQKTGCCSMIMELLILVDDHANDFYIFSNLKSMLKRCHHKSVNTNKKCGLDLSTLTENNCCYDQLEKRYNYGVTFQE